MGRLEPGEYLKEKPKRVYLECTATLFSGYHTGIQRVVKNVIFRCNELSQFFGLPVIPVIFAFRKAWTFSKVEQNFLKIQKFFKIKSKTEKLILNLSFFLHSISILKKKSKFKNLNSPPNKIYRIILSLWRHIEMVILFFFIPFKPVFLTKEDLLLVIDDFWDYQLIKYFTQIYRNGVEIIPLIYDIIPIYYPEFYKKNLVKEFNDSFYRLISISSGIIGVSKTSIKEIMELLRKKGIPVENLTFDYFYPGSDFKKSKEDGQGKRTIRQWPSNLWEGEEVYLMVGTIEPRKRYGFVLDAFEKMWAQGFEAKLLIIGRVGWKTEEVLKRVKKSPYRGKRLFVYQDINDDELLYCYKNSSALILASCAEGFGLPMIEAMEVGLPIVASDIEVFREIGGDYPLYFSLNSMDSLIEAIQQVPKNKKIRKDWISWDKSAQTLLSKALSIYERRKKSQLI
jgi:alpha-1,2-rhamnosyltransferase